MLKLQNVANSILHDRAGRNLELRSFQDQAPWLVQACIAPLVLWERWLSWNCMSQWQVMEGSMKFLTKLAKSLNKGYQCLNSYLLPSIFCWVTCLLPLPQAQTLYMIFPVVLSSHSMNSQCLHSPGRSLSPLQGTLCWEAALHTPFSIIFKFLFQYLHH